MPKIIAIPRLLLGERGFALDDDAYAQTVAGLGMYFKSHGSQEFIVWSPQNFQIELARCGPLSKAREAWLNALVNITERRLLVEGNDPYKREVDLVSVVRILNWPAVGVNAVVVEKELPQADLRWQWPLRLHALRDDLECFKLQCLADVWPSRNLANVDLITREQSRCEILVMQGGARLALRRILELPYQLRAGHVLLIGPADVAWRDLSGHIGALAAEIQAGAVSLVSCKEAEVASQINRLVEELSHNIPYDLALARSFPRDSSFHLMDLRLLDAAALTTVALDIGRSLRHLPPAARLSVPGDALARARLGWDSSRPPHELGAELEVNATNIPFDGESQGASSLKEIGVAMRGARSEAASTEVPRFLQGDLFKFSEGAPTMESRGLVVGRRYRLDVFIGPKGEGAITATEIFDDAQLNWGKKNSFTLQVIFADPRQWEQPFTGTLKLPREGTSSKCTFEFSPTVAGPFAGRITLYYRGRILQTALLESTVVEQETELEGLAQLEPLRVESQVRYSLSTLDERRRFDVCMVLNHTTAGTPTVTVGDREGAYIASLDTVKPQLSAINGILNDVANKVKYYSKGLLSKENAQLLRDLAYEGHWLYRNLVVDYLYKSSAAEALRKAEYLQILSTRPDQPIPLEFVYDYPPPDKDAPVCPNAIQALIDKDCPENCNLKQNPSLQVCPLGFWGLRRVIERHQFNPDLARLALVTGEKRNEPTKGRDVLPLQGASLLAASKEVTTVARSKLEKNMRAAWQRFGEVVSVNSWAEWQTAVHEKRPVFILALPHTAGSGSHISLEISGETKESGIIDEEYIKRDTKAIGPLVVLFGCDTANVANTEAYASHITVFRQAGAALVLGTVATVFGPAAAKVAEQIVQRLVEASNTSTLRFGEVLRQVKRKAVAESMMLAMCLVAFGDADWRLK